MAGSTTNYRQRGAILILMAGIMLLLGLTLLKHSLLGKWYVLYWFGCLALTMLAMFCALWDFRAIRRQLREAQLDLLRNHFSNLAGHDDVFALLEHTSTPAKPNLQDDKNAPPQPG